MRGVRVVGSMVMVCLLGGCAGMKSHQDLARLQSQVGLLDERITQLERSSVGEAGDRTTSESTTDAGSLSAVAIPKTGASASAQGAATLKPSTREIQQALKNAGFYQGAVDGKTGPLTKSAVKEFQRIHGLKADGVVGKQTWAKLRSYANLAASAGEANAAEVLK